MSTATDLQGPGRQEVRQGMIALARFGYAAKGLVYAVVGLLAMRAAWTSGRAGEAGEGTRSAITEIGRQPFGQLLLVLTGVGLLGYVLWRLVQAIKDPDREGNDAKGLLKRGGFLISAVAYALLAYTALSVAWGLPGGGGEGQQSWTAWLMSLPLGRWLVALAGLTVLGVGLAHFQKVRSGRFMREFKTAEMSAHEQHLMKRSGQFGLSARGVTFAIIGGLLVLAALRHDASEEGGLGSALQTLADQPFGPWLLLLVAIGLVAYGIYCFLRARYRYIRVD